MRYISGLIALPLLILGVCQAQSPATANAGSRDVVVTITPKHAPRTLVDIVQQSVVVITASCEQELPARFFVLGNPRANVVVDRIVRVTSVLKGNVQVDTRAAVEQLGGTVQQYDGNHTVKETYRNAVPLQPGLSYILFLRPEQQRANDDFDGKRYVVTGEWSGVFAVVNGRVVVPEGADAILRQLDGLSQAEVVALVKKSL